MKLVAVVLMLFGNSELNRGHGLPQVQHCNGLPSFVLLPPPPPQVAISPPLKDELICAEEAAPPAEPPRKWGRLHDEDAIRHQLLVKELAVGLVSDCRHLCSVYGCCNFKKSETLCSALCQMMKQDPALVEVMKGCNRSNPGFVQAALLAMDRIVPPRDGVQASPRIQAIQASLSLEAVHGAISETRLSPETSLTAAC